MAEKPNYRVTRSENDGSGKTETVGRHTTASAARASVQTKKTGEELGSSRSYGVTEIKHRR
jgi:hypothetical protein